MRLYLSSFRVGDHADTLLSLVGAGRRAVLVPNAVDEFARAARDVADLEALGFSVSVADLRTEPVPACDLLWVRGGNVFTLRRALAARPELAGLVRAGSFVYGGYSAGACVLAPDLHGLEAIDPPGDDPVWTGLGLLDRPVVPHVDTPEHPEGATCDALSAAFTAAGRPHWALRDGDVLVVRGSAPPRVLPRAARRDHATSGG
jgi:dipeptidase E